MVRVTQALPVGALGCRQVLPTGWPAPGKLSYLRTEDFEATCNSPETKHSSHKPLSQLPFWGLLSSGKPSSHGPD